MQPSIKRQEFSARRYVSVIFYLNSKPDKIHNFQDIEMKFKQLMHNLERRAQDQNELKEKSIKETNMKLGSLQQHYKLLKIQFDDFKEECSNAGTRQLDRLNNLKSEIESLQIQNKQCKVGSLNCF